MNPSDKGWLNMYLGYHERRLLEGDEVLLRRLAEEARDSHEYLYRLIQPTGLMYGYPVTFIHEAHPRVSEWGEKEKIKILLAESFFNVGLYHIYQQTGRLRGSREVQLTYLREFYLKTSNRFKISKSGRIGRRRYLIDQVEYMLDRSIDFSYDWRNFWNSFFHNTLLFFDLMLYAQWLGEETILHVGESLGQVQQVLRFKILKIIAAAAHADGEVSPEERELFNHFLTSAHLPAPQKKQALAFLRDGITLEELDLTRFPSWILRKYFLELAILTSWASRAISPAEEAFLIQFADVLGLSDEELEASTRAVTDFVMTHWQQVHYLHIKQNYRIVTEQVTQRLRLLVKRNQRMIAQEIRESRELVHLLRQSTQRELSPEEWEKVREQLLDILRTIPAFTIFMLPMGSITLPLLLRIIPKNVLYPSSFRENEDYQWQAATGSNGLFLWPSNPENGEEEMKDEDESEAQ